MSLLRRFIHRAVENQSDSSTPTGVVGPNDCGSLFCKRPADVVGGSEWGSSCLVGSTVGRSSLLLPVGGYPGIGEQLAIGLHIGVSSREQNIAVED